MNLKKITLLDCLKYTFNWLICWVLKYYINNYLVEKVYLFICKVMSFSYVTAHLWAEICFSNSIYSRIKLSKNYKVLRNRV